ncbi:hypothetical protein HZH66_001272 [Vespula vulgaris]|uniref:Uncharacterized protein n=1 Tax=Vespula vulgaris TaxID=7454 RepID=A0A834KUQ8_VESVU|nr:hypothetical protein HZH66_001272 [Vespula vulgaris]
MEDVKTRKRKEIRETSVQCKNINRTFEGFSRCPSQRPECKSWMPKGETETGNATGTKTGTGNGSGSGSGFLWPGNNAPNRFEKLLGDSNVCQNMTWVTHSSNHAT